MASMGEFVVSQTFRGKDPFLLEENRISFRDKESALSAATRDWRSGNFPQIFVSFISQNDQDIIGEIIWWRNQIFLDEVNTLRKYGKLHLVTPRLPGSGAYPILSKIATNRFRVHGDCIISGDTGCISDGCERIIDLIEEHFERWLGAYVMLGLSGDLILRGLSVRDETTILHIKERNII